MSTASLTFPTDGTKANALVGHFTCRDIRQADSGRNFVRDAACACSGQFTARVFMCALGVQYAQCVIVLQVRSASVCPPSAETPTVT